MTDIMQDVAEARYHVHVTYADRTDFGTMKHFRRTLAEVDALVGRWMRSFGHAKIRVLDLRTGEFISRDIEYRSLDGETRTKSIC